MQISNFPALLVEKIVFLGVECSSMSIVLFYLEKRKLSDLEFTPHLLDCHSRFSRLVKSIHSQLFFSEGTMRVIGLSGIKDLQGVCQTQACLPRVPVLEVSPDSGVPPTCASAGGCPECWGVQVGGHLRGGVWRGAAVFRACLRRDQST